MHEMRVLLDLFPLIGCIMRECPPQRLAVESHMHMLLAFPLSHQTARFLPTAFGGADARGGTHSGAGAVRAVGTTLSAGSAALSTAARV